MFNRFSDNAKMVLSHARQEAISLQHGHITAEHILLGLLQLADCSAARLLAQLGVPPAELAAALLAVMPKGATTSSGQLPFTPGAKRVLELSLEEASRLGHTFLGSQHLLLGLARVANETPAQILAKLGADVE